MTALRSLPTLQQSARWRYLNFFVLYFLQGLVPGLFGACLMNHFISKGFTVGAIGSFGAVVALPWSLQFLWGPVVDGFRSSKMGERRFWQIIAFAGCMTCFALAATFVSDPVKQVSLVMGILFFHSLFAALLDVTTDALMIDTAPEEEKGRSASAGRVGFTIGSSLGALMFAPVLNRYGFAAAVELLAAIWLILGMIPLFTREKPSDKLFSLGLRPAPKGACREPRSVKEFVKEFWAALATPTGLKLCALFFFVDFGLGAFGVGFGVDLIQKYGWDAEKLTRLQGILSLLGGTVISLGIGWFSDRIGHFRALRLFLGTSAVLYFTFALLFARGWDMSLSPLMMVLQSTVPTFLFVAATPAIMSLDKSPLAATRFTLIMAAMNFGDVAGGAAAGYVHRYLTSPMITLLLGAVFLLGALSLHRPKRRRAAVLGQLVPVPATNRPALALAPAKSA